METERIIDIPRDSQGRIKWLALQEEPTVLFEVIENEARKAFECGLKITKQDLCGNGFGGLYIVIRKNYPGSLRELRTKLDCSLDRKSPGYWTPETIRKEAEIFYQHEGDLTQGLLAEKGRCDLAAAISRLYPGRLFQLKDDLGIEGGRMPKGFWTEEEIKKQAVDLFSKWGKLTKTLLEKRGHHDLIGAITLKYSGGLTQLKIDLGINLNKKPSDYWTTERIVKEARAIYQKEGKLTQQLLSELDRHDLVGAISARYPGGLTQLKADLGITLTKKPNQYWTPEKIKQEAQLFYQSGGQLSSKSLREGNREDLLNAIMKHYPGKLFQLCSDLGINVIRKPNQYWTLEIIEQEAQQFLNQNGDLSYPLLSKKGQNGLGQAIRQYFPGGINALKEKLGLIPYRSKKEMLVSPQEAYEELKKLLEEV